MAVVLARGLQDSVSGADVVHQEIAIGMQGDGSERGRNGVSAAIDFGSGGGGGERLYVARGAAHLFEQGEPFYVQTLCRLTGRRARVLCWRE